ncbi:MAG: bacteriorhodopsin [bacterium]|nr:bacteriorhodopsin [bacterium]
MMTIETIFLLSLILMGLSTLFFFVLRNATTHYRSALAVTSATTVASLVLFSGAVWIGDLSPFRWLFYIVSCSVLMMTIMKVLSVKKENKTPILILNGLVMLTGAIASFFRQNEDMMLAFFVLGGVFFLMQLMLLAENNAKKSTSKMVWTYILAGWCAFPLVFVLSPEAFSIIDAAIAAILYLALDIFTKVGFYIHLSKLK